MLLLSFSFTLAVVYGRCVWGWCQKNVCASVPFTRYSTRRTVNYLSESRVKALASTFEAKAVKIWSRGTWRPSLYHWCRLLGTPHYWCCTYDLWAISVTGPTFWYSPSCWTQTLAWTASQALWRWFCYDTALFKVITCSYILMFIVIDAECTFVACI